MTRDDREQIGWIFDSLNQRPEPAPSGLSPWVFLFGCLMVCLTLLFWPELRAAVAGLYVWWQTPV
jgi:hypothetical protein